MVTYSGGANQNQEMVDIHFAMALQFNDPAKVAKLEDFHLLQPPLRYH
jgi:hypothetical protein